MSPIDFLFPAPSLTPLLAADAVVTGLVTGGLMAAFLPLKSTPSERSRRAFFYGGLWGMATCLVVLFLYGNGPDGGKLTPYALANALVLAFLSTGLISWAIPHLVGRVISRRRGRVEMVMRRIPVQHLPGPRETFGSPAISTRRR